MGNVMPLKFTDPDVERQTYVAAFVATIHDQWDGTPLDIDKAVDILRRYGYNKLSIAAYVAETCQQFEREQRGKS